MADPHNSQPPAPVSHVHGLLESIAAAPSRIAPERVDELKQLVEKHNIELHINDKGKLPSIWERCLVACSLP